MKQRDFLLIVSFTFITVLLWIILTIYHMRVTSTISPALQKTIEPIEPRFDTSIIETLGKQRRGVNILPETTIPSPSPTTPVASPSPTLTITQSPTPSPGGLNL